MKIRVQMHAVVTSDATRTRVAKLCFQRIFLPSSTKFTAALDYP